MRAAKELRGRSGVMAREDVWVNEKAAVLLEAEVVWGWVGTSVGVDQSKTGAGVLTADCARWG